MDFLPALRGLLIRYRSTQEIQTRRRRIMPTKKKAVTAYLTEEEFENVKTWAERSRLTLSTFIRKVSQGQPVKSLEHQMFRLELRRLRADLGRLGGLFKQGLAENKGPDHELRRLLREIDGRQRELRDAVDRIR